MTRRSRRAVAEPEVSAAEFKAKCLSLMEDVSRRDRSFTITKRGKPVARLVPVPRKDLPLIGFLRGSLLHGERLDEPTGETWEAES
ncbi:MAG TPA: type II toxin-antitoxin system prevent-host-death family antitoxin [Candidatus Tyrphobacter sp.]